VRLILAIALLPAACGQDWTGVADTLSKTDATAYVFDWGEGVQMLGMMKAWGHARRPAYAEFVNRWAQHHLPKGTVRLLRNEPESPRKGFCGYWVCGTAFLYLNDALPQPALRRTAIEFAEFIRSGATRSQEGALGHWVGNHQIWIDTLHMACPLLARLAVEEKRPEYLDDAAKQLLLAAKYMMNPRTLLFHHMYDWDKTAVSEVQWGRGNGWYIMAMADTLEYMPRTHQQHAALKGIAEKHAKGLLGAQAGDGTWRTIPDDPAAYPESSATTMAIYGLLKLARLGVLPARYRAPALKAWKTVNGKWVADGVVTGVSEGTLPEGRAHYLGRKMGTYTWGTGSYLLAGSEVARVQP
jgi:rhamnogalacturonyl hydrolase YesR